MASRTTKIPAIRKSHNVPKEVSVILSAIKQTLEVREGLRGDPLDRFISVRELRELMDTDHETVLTITTATDHGGLVGLADDDHTQYYNSARIAVWSGSPNITTLGTIGAGTWQGTPIANAYVAGLDQDLLQSSSPTFAGLTINGSITVTGNVDGRDVSADGAKLDTALQSDGTVPLTADWDVGAGNVIRGDTVKARSSSGVQLYDENGKGVFVKDGVVGINSTPVPANILTLNTSTTDPPSSFFGASISNLTTLTSSQTQYTTGITSRAITTIGAGIVDSGYIKGGNFDAYINGDGQVNQTFGISIQSGIYTNQTGKVVEAIGVWARILNLGTGEITQGKGIKIESSVGSGTIGTIYGVYINDLAATTTYGIYQVGSNDKNYFAGNVGIGTNSPETKLHVAGGDILLDNDQAIRFKNAAGTYNAAVIGYDNSNNMTIGGGIAGDMIFKTNSGVEAMRVKSSGQVGINEDSPGARLQITYSDPADIIRLKDSDTGDYYSFRFDASGNLVLRYNNGTNDYYPIKINRPLFGDVLTIDSSGRVGISTNSSTAVLDINSDVFRLRTSKTPSSASDTGNQGDICWDSSYVYVCVATNTWKRAALNTW